MKDIQFTLPKTMQITPNIQGKTSVQGLMVYQKLMILILSPASGLYRQEAGTTLTELLEGANTPSDEILLALGTSACLAAKNLLDIEDADRIKNVTAQAQNGSLSITLQLQDGEIYTGVLTA